MKREKGIQGLNINENGENFKSQIIEKSQIQDISHNSVTHSSSVDDYNIY